MAMALPNTAIAKYKAIAVHLFFIYFEIIVM